MSNSANITREQLRVVLLATELGGKAGDAGHFSYAQLANSSSSFGEMQFDVGANPAARDFLADNGFDAADIAALSRNERLAERDQARLDAKLQAIPRLSMDQFTGQQLDATIGRVGRILENVREYNPVAADAIVNNPALQLGIADYANQFSSRHDGQLAAFLAGNPERGIQAGSPSALEDMQAFIGATAYGRNKANARGIESRKERLEGALFELGLRPTPVVGGFPPNGSVILKEHTHGTAVSKLQAQLMELGYTDAKGRLLQPDGDFGPVTRAAVETFQRDHGLLPDGKVGSVTWGALQADVQPLKEDDPGLLPAVSAMSNLPPVTPSLDDPRNVMSPNHALYSTLKERIPDASDSRLLQFTAACHAGQINVENLDRIDFDRTDGRMTFRTSWPPVPATSVDLKMPSPAPEQSVRHIHQYDQQQAQMRIQINARDVSDTPQLLHAPVAGGLTY
jgi:hypothetical protein